MPVDPALFGDSGWFAACPESLREALVARGQWRKYAPGERATGDVEAPQAGMFGVYQGTFDIKTPRADGELVTFHSLSRGHWIGDISILSEQNQLAVMEARVASEVLFVPAPVVLDIVTRTPAHYRDFYRLTRRNMNIAIEALIGLVASGADHKIAFRLLQLDRMNCVPGGWLDMSQNDLAEMLGLSIASVRRGLAALAGASAIELGYARMRVHRARLASWIETH